MLRADESFLKELAETARARVDGGYYSVKGETRRGRRSIAGSLGTKEKIPIIAEVKFRSPSEGALSRTKDVEDIARAYEKGGAAGVSVLTEPEHFDGSLEYVSVVSSAVRVPVLMKDIVVDRIQVEAGRKVGADAVLLIAGVFGGGGAGSLARMVRHVHENGLEAVVEVHDRDEYLLAVSGEADVVGVNNRNLRSLSVSLDVSRELLAIGPHRKPVICESGISTREEIDSLRGLGADGFLLGSALMKAADPEETLRRLTRI